MTNPFDLVCLSHLRWDSVYQRPHHLLSRFARERRVYFVEEPVTDADGPWLERRSTTEGVTVVVPHLAASTSAPLVDMLQMLLLDDLFTDEQIAQPVLWYYTPMARAFTRHLSPRVVVYDCMDELSAFQGAPAAMRHAERDLLLNADLVFTGGMSLYEAKRHRHPRVFAMPSGVEADHFAQARLPQADQPQQAELPHPRVGFYGVLDERLDRALLADLADARPEWSFILIGPVAKIERSALPQRPNLHYLGRQPYAALPAFLAGWDVAMMPFAHNDATRFISPTKTPEFLAAGKPVVSTSITDVVHPFGDAGLARIADTPADFIAACEAAMREDATARQARVEPLLRQQSWDRLWQRMARLVDETARAMDALPRLDPVALAEAQAVPPLDDVSLDAGTWA